MRACACGEIATPENYKKAVDEFFKKISRGPMASRGKMYMTREVWMGAAPKGSAAETFHAMGWDLFDADKNGQLSVRFCLQHLSLLLVLLVLMIL